jgi:RNA polymerase sigma-70 factor (ECF subfamily)
MRDAGFRAEFGDIAVRLYARSGASRWNVSQTEFSAALDRAIERRFSDSGDARDHSAVVAFLESLQLEDLALALGCRAGNNAAWREFDGKFRSVIENIARRITRDSDRARELADSLYGDLFGDARSDGTRRSPLDHYHGRSPLAAWLRVVIAQREAQAWRAEYRAHPDGNRDFAPSPADNSAPEPDDPDRSRYLAMVSCELRKAIDSLAARDRLRLSYYYVQELTLAETGTLLGEHESTVSRGLARTRTEIRQNVERGLRQEYHLSDDQIGRCFEYAVGDWPFDLARTLEQAK